MRHFLFFFVCLFACTMPSVAEATCNASAHVPWRSSGRLGYQIEAYAAGSSCQSAVVVLAVIDRGKPIWVTSRIADQVAMFSGSLLAKDTPMKEALTEWLETGFKVSPANTGTLPDWPQGASEPKRPDGEEFGFFIAPDVSRESYLEWREKKLPMFCFVQGMESESCIIVGDFGGIYEIGGMTFPG
jgi:hypothetical protein